MYKYKATNILTKYDLPIKSDLISRGKQYRSNNTEIDSPPNHVLTIMIIKVIIIIIIIIIIVILIVINSYIIIKDNDNDNADESDAQKI